MNAVRELGLAPIDWIGLVLVSLFLLLGAVRGLWWQVFRLVGVVLAVLIARAVTPQLVPAAHEALPGLPLPATSGLVWVLLFMLSLGTAGLVGRLGKKSLKAMHLSSVDRLGGALAGGLTGAFLHVALVVGIDHLTGQSFADRTLGGTYSMSAYETFGARLPEALARERQDSEPRSEDDERPRVR